MHHLRGNATLARMALCQCSEVKKIAEIITTVTRQAVGAKAVIISSFKSCEFSALTYSVWKVLCYSF